MVNQNSLGYLEAKTGLQNYSQSQWGHGPFLSKSFTNGFIGLYRDIAGFGDQINRFHIDSHGYYQGNTKVLTLSLKLDQ